MHNLTALAPGAIKPVEVAHPPLKLRSNQIKCRLTRYLFWGCSQSDTACTQAKKQKTKKQKNQKKKTQKNNQEEQRNCMSCDALSISTKGIRKHEISVICCMPGRWNYSDLSVTMHRLTLTLASRQPRAAGKQRWTRFWMQTTA